LKWEVTVTDHDVDFNTFLAISSEADHILNKEIESNFSKDWIESCNKKRTEMELSCREEVDRDCMKFIKRFTDAK
jgi:hypothetical protein